MLHVTELVRDRAGPCEADATVAVRPAGSVSVICTPTAGCGPRFCAVST